MSIFIKLNKILKATAVGPLPPLPTTSPPTFLKVALLAYQHPIVALVGREDKNCFLLIVIDHESGIISLKYLVSHLNTTQRVPALKGYQTGTCQIH